MLDRKFFPILLVLVIVNLALTTPGSANSQTVGDAGAESIDNMVTTSDGSTYSLDEIKQARMAAENAEDLTPDARRGLISYMDRAIYFIEKRSQLRKETRDYIQKAQEAPHRIITIEKELDRTFPPLENIHALAAEMSTEQLEKRLREEETRFFNAEKRLNRLNVNLISMKTLPEKLQQELTDAEKRLKKIAAGQSELASLRESHQLKNAHAVMLAAEKAKIQAEIDRHRARLDNHTMLTALALAERDLAVREKSRQAILVKIWQTSVQRSREGDAQKEREEAEQAKMETQDLPVAVQKEFDVNIDLGKALEKVAADEAATDKRLETQKARLQQMADAFDLAREEVRYPIQTEAIGLALREQRRGLPKFKDFSRESKQREFQMGEIRSAQLYLERQRMALTDTDMVIQRIMAQDDFLPEVSSGTVKSELHQLLKDRRNLVMKLQANYRRLFRKIEMLEHIEQKIAAKADEMAEFLDEHLLWFRSGKKLSLMDLKNLPQALAWFFSPQNWWTVVRDLRRCLSEKTLAWMLVLLISFTAFGLRWRAHQYLSFLAGNVYSIKTDNFFLTLKAIGTTFRVALGWPLLMIFTGWQLRELSMAGDFTGSVASGLPIAGWTLGAGLLVFECCRQQGLIKVHFKWPERTRRFLRQSTLPLIFVLMSMGFLVAAIEFKRNPLYMNSLGRLVMMLCIGGGSLWVFFKVTGSGPQGVISKRRSNSFISRMKFLWFSLSIGIPLWLIILAGMGYYYTTFALYRRLCQTTALILALILLKDLVLRWIYITKRRIAFKEMERKKEAAAKADDSDGPTDGVGGESMVVEEPEIDLNQLYDQNQSLLLTLMLSSALMGLWMIWANVLPALNFLEQVELWRYSTEVEGVRTMVPITLANLMVALTVAVVTVVAARNWPGLLEIILMNWFPLDRGLRYAISTVFNYTITATGMLTSLAIIGFKWSNVQWLIAALGVGIGFGLQEVVANFICGLIVLFERPYRIGDTVTIGDISGIVSRIKIRATTIMDFDRKELIVPNKEFITGRLVNWSLSDDLVRIRIPVGLAYGSDTALAEKLLLEVADANPSVAKKPAPQAVFLGFGDNSLNFEVRVYINGIDDWVTMMHAMHQSIDREFRRKGVTISFPQRDVHLDQVGPLEVRVVSDGNVKHSQEPSPVNRES
jgi:potassium efflux system protein